MNPMDVFVTEGNVEIYLSRLYATWSAEERQKLLSLVIAEEAKMGLSREHLENGQRRVADGRERVARQRALVAALPQAKQAGSQAALLLRTLEELQALLEQHLEVLQQRHEGSRL
ncbi:MAG: hypothetical protein ACOY4R_26390 [Pseudomonadota bacterium]